MVLIHRVVFLLVLLIGFSSSVAEQNASIFDTLDMKVFNGTLAVGTHYFDGCNRSYTETLGNVRYPNHKIVAPTHIVADINITGYNGTVVVDGVVYVGGCPSDLAIIYHDVSTNYAGFEANKDWVQRDITIVSEGGNTTATMVVQFMWHWTTHSSITGANTKHYRLETKTVSVTKPHPEIISLPNVVNATAHITYYNDSATPITFIDVCVPDSVIKTVYTYNNTSIVKYIAIGVVHGSGVAFLNDTTVWQADPNQTTMTRRGDSAVVRGEQLNMSLLNITISTPYTQHTIDDLHVRVVEPREARPWLFLKIMMTFGTLIMGMILLLGAVRRSL